MIEIKRSSARCKAYLNHCNHNDLIDDFKNITFKITNDINEVLNKLNNKENIFESIRLSSGIRSAKGNELRNLFWWNIKIKEGYLPERFKNYTNILLTPYRCNYDENNEIILGVCNEFPHIDNNTGNFHPEFKLCEWIQANNEKSNINLGQAVLVSKLGPKLRRCNIENFNDNELLKYNNKLIVPKDCYFPRLDEKEQNVYSIEELVNGLLSNVL